jgi:hypothetical protein
LSSPPKRSNKAFSKEQNHDHVQPRLLATLSVSGEASLKINDGRYAVFPKMFVTLQAKSVKRTNE